MKDIIIVAAHPCIRVLKQATVLKDLGYKLHLIFGEKIFGPLTAGSLERCQLFESIQFYANRYQFEASIKNILHISNIFHIHNEPNWPVIKVRELVPDAKIIFDIHDSMYWRQDKEYREEDVAVDCSDFMVVPSDACKDELSGRTDKQVIVIPSAVPEKWYKLPSFSQGGLCSEGGHVLPDSEAYWRDFTDTYKMILKAGKEVYAYSAMFTQNEKLVQEFEITKHYAGLGAKLANAEYDILLEMMGTHDWNLVGNYRQKEHKVFKYALPNKFFDGLAAGIPPAVFNRPEVIKIVQENDIGIVCETPDELVDRWDEHREKRKNLMLERSRFSMENFISVLTDLYDSI